MYWVTIKTELRDSPEYTACSRSARLSYYELMILCGRKETDTLNMTTKQVAAMLGISIAQAEADLNELVEAALIERNDEGQIKFPDMTEQVGKLTEKREAARKRVDEYREKSKRQPPTSGKDAETHGNQDGNTLPVSGNNTNDDCNNYVTRYERTSKVKKSKVKLSKDDAGKKIAPPKIEPAAAEPESIKLWRDWTLHTGKIAQSFLERLTTEVKDIEVWADTLAFGAKNRKIAHTNTGLDWALTNYKTGIAQKRANALPKNQSNSSNIVGKYADKLVKTEIDGVEVYYG